MGSILVHLQSSNPYSRPLDAQQKARLEAQAAALPAIRVVPLVSK